MERRQGVAAERTNFSERIADIGSELGRWEIGGRNWWMFRGGGIRCYLSIILSKIWLPGVVR